ncbi:hypothetical protein J2T57_001568 [Natronocella acetinitrilica]|uniref:Uncharacterized protein n=1 Tax=Natronocella acetinitrilica TaxID=414046 RepID=A0AAE3KBB3_9GAMM|nr:hypothetical protein [Natronocella acetinitrilica]MCP1674466.1 hypothetical protein [Natronocella acetinitrilica]
MRESDGDDALLTEALFVRQVGYWRRSRRPADWLAARAADTAASMGLGVDVLERVLSTEERRSIGLGASLALRDTDHDLAAHRQFIDACRRLGETAEIDIYVASLTGNVREALRGALYLPEQAAVDRIVREAERQKRAVARDAGAVLTVAPPGLTGLARSIWLAIREARAAGGDAARVAASSNLLHSETDPWLTEAEQARARALRRTAVDATTVSQMLCATPDEIRRWNADGRLPHLIENYWVTHMQGQWRRRWALEDIEAARERIGAWRERDAVARHYRQSGLRLVAGASA